MSRRLTKSARPRDRERLTLYYASDVHGSERCWRKFLAAGSFYGASQLVMGGDLTGKAIVPIVSPGDGTYEATFLGERHAGSDEASLHDLLAAIRFNGMYPWLATAAEIADAAADPQLQARLFDEVIVAEIRRWVEIADEKLTGDGPGVFVIGGNDDPWSIDAPLRAARRLTFCDDDVVALGPHELASLSYANPTPWDSPRELDEEALYERLKRLTDRLERPQRAILNLHVPPHGSGLDTANEIDPETLTRVLAGGQPVDVPVGSVAVRHIIEEIQPLLALHGHIHESKGEARIGRTLCLNPGSDYASGRIDGALVRLEPDRVVSHQFVNG